MTICAEFSSDLRNLRSYLIDLRLRVKQIKTNKKITYYNVASAYDIEASSFYDNFIMKPENKRGLMYAWVFGIDEFTIIGRTWEQFIQLTNLITETLELSAEKRLIVYVHNLGYDFQFFRPYLTFDRVFALDMREPIQAVSEGGIEFRCSYKLSGYSLAKVGEHLTRHTVKKMVGDLDYNLIRTPKTPLKPKEKNYILHDALVVLAYIKEEIEDHDNDITKIPLTKTGKVRTYCRNACLHTFKSHKKRDPKFYRYHKLMTRLTIPSVFQYKLLRQAFMGGYTHGNHLHIGEICDNVASLDETSAYPYVMVSQLYPMSKGELITIKDKADFIENLKYYHAIFTATFYNIDETFTYDHYISISKCIEKEGIVADNGRLVKADKITIIITNIDFEIIQKTYKWEKLKVRNFVRYKKGLLPRDFVLAILDFYEKKTTLKDVEDKIIEYQQSKENVNGCFGMTVTDICREEIIYNDYFEEVDNEAWLHKEPDFEKMIEKYNKDKKRFLYYPWGVFVTCHARKIIWEAIIENGEDHRYSDTDSVKLTNFEKHKEYYIKYNRRLLARLKKVMSILDIPFEKCTPKTIKGVIKPIGVFEYEGTYKRFKYLGAKRYMVEDEKGEINLTVSGINKFVCIPYLKKTYGDNTNIFNAFNDGLIIPKGYTGKQIHTYIDYETEGDIRDYLGNDYHYHELSGIHMEDTEYSLSISEEFLRYLLGSQLKVI